MTYSVEATQAAGKALKTLLSATLRSETHLDETLRATLSLVVMAMIKEGASPDAIEGAMHTGVEWAVEPPH